jgi:hypothetical protein
MVVLQATQDIRKVSLWLGHSSLTTTEVYVRADPTEKLEAIEAIVPPSLRKGKFRPPDKLLALLKSQVLMESGRGVPPRVAALLLSRSPLLKAPHKTRNGVHSITCRNLHCPKCQGLARAQWLESRQAELLVSGPPVEVCRANIAC